jgi:hypothetical protein
MAHSAVLLKAKVKALQDANQAKKRRARKQKKRIQYSGSLTVEEGENIVQNAAIEAQIQQEMKGPQRRCGLCNNIGHNSRTCKRRQETQEFIVID